MTNEQVENLIQAIRRIASGGTGGPDGLETVAIALGGEGLNSSVAEGLRDVASAIRELAEAVRELAPK
jgi:hypothetical protein